VATEIKYTLVYEDVVNDVKNSPSEHAQLDDKMQQEMINQENLQHVELENYKDLESDNGADGDGDQDQGGDGDGDGDGGLESEDD